MSLNGDDDNQSDEPSLHRLPNTPKGSYEEYSLPKQQSQYVPYVSNIMLGNFGNMDHI